MRCGCIGGVVEGLYVRWERGVLGWGGVAERELGGKEIGSCRICLCAQRHAGIEFCEGIREFDLCWN